MKISPMDRELIHDIVKMRRDLRWSQERLAQKIGVSKQRMNAIENYRSSMSKENREKLALLVYEWRKMNEGIPPG